MEFDNTESKQFPLVDSHAHIDMPEFDPDRDQVIERSFAAGISALLCPMEVTDPESIRKTRWITDRYPNIIAAAGAHPHSAKDFSAESGHTIRNLAEQGGIHALGEIGLDFHYNFSLRDEQVHAFRKQLNLAQELNLPVIIHSRLASDEVLDAIRGEGYARGGVLHCFTESRGFAEQMLDLGFYISFSGILTFPKARDIQETAQSLPLDRVMVETDSPFLAPVPYRGRVQRNEPAYVRETARFLAGLKQLPLEELCTQTTRNFTACFGFEIPGH
ncbi:MAG: TatD family hydrolase [Candidatus Aminicenantaceae bacterium]